MNSSPLLQVNHLTKAFPVHGGVFRREIGSVKAVTDVSFSVEAGKTLGIVGESGCGKTTLGRTLVRLYDPSEGEIRFQGENITTFDWNALKKVRREMQMIFQDPYGSLNPRMPVRLILEEPLRLHKVGNAKERYQRVCELLNLVGLRRDVLERYPHEFSGGQRQRISIARALALNPKLIIADEPVSALDVSIQSQVLNLLVDLQKQLNLTYIFISHDLAVVQYITDNVAVMYLGRIVEMASKEQLFRNARHPYTMALLRSVPIPDPRKRGHDIEIAGDIPSPANPPPGCTFHTRCPFATDICRAKVPELEDSGNGHQVACHNKSSLSLS